jgi:hypothetical protein
MGGPEQWTEKHLEWQPEKRPEQGFPDRTTAKHSDDVIMMTL